MYKLNLTPAYLSDEQEKELFNPESFKKLISALNEKKEIEEMTESDLLLDTLMQKQVNILNKVQIVDEKCSDYKLTEKGEIIERLIASFDEVEIQLDESIQGFEKIESLISNLLDRARGQIEEAWTVIQENYKDKLVKEFNKDFWK